MKKGNTYKSIQKQKIRFVIKNFLFIMNAKKVIDKLLFIY